MQVVQQKPSTVTSAFTAQTQSRHKKNFAKATPFIITACILVALVSVLLVPLFVGGTTPAQSQQSTYTNAQNFVEYSSTTQAASTLAITPALPASLPEGVNYVNCGIAEGRVLQMRYDLDGQQVIFNVAAGNEDLSGVDYDKLAYTATEESGGITHLYAGVSDEKLTCAVWVQQDYTYALVAESGIDAQIMRTFVQNVA